MHTHRVPNFINSLYWDKKYLDSEGKKWGEREREEEEGGGGGE